MKYNVNTKVAPKDWATFEPWHAKACKKDPLSAEERFKEMGGKVPKKESKESTPKK